MKKFVSLFVFLFVLLFAVTPVYAAGHLQEAGPVTFEGVLQSILYVAGIFAMLPGVALLVGAVVNIAKAVAKFFGASFDGKSDQVAAWLNLAIFFALIYYRLFRPDVTFEWLDAQAKIMAEALVAMSFFFAQLGLQPVAHSLLKGKLPLVGTSFSK